ncbi:MAG: EamA family transporter, partial [Promethearchaeota archaeon]
MGGSEIKKARISMFLSGTFMGLVGLYVSVLPGPMISVALRGLFASISLIMFLGFKGVLKRVFKFIFSKELIKLEIVQGISGSVLIFCYFLGISLVGYSVSVFLLYTGGAFSLIFGRIILKEKVAFYKWISFIIALIGVAIILEPWKNGTNILNNIGILASLSSGIILGLDIIIKKILFKRIIKRIEVNGEYIDKEKEINGFNTDKSRSQEIEKINNQNVATVMDNSFLLNLLIGTALIRTIFLVIFFLPLSNGLLYGLNALQWFAGFMLGTLSGGVAFSLYNFGLIKD